MSNKSTPGLLAALICGLIAIGMVFGASLWVLAGIAGVLVYSLSYLLAQAWGSAVTVDRGESDRGESDRSETEPEGTQRGGTRVGNPRWTTGDMEVRQGSRVPIKVSVTNTSKLPLAWVLVEDLIPRDETAGNSAATNSAAGTGSGELSYRPPLEIEGARIGVFLLAPGAKRTLEYTISCRRRGY
ncbi:MAG: hypothetical protein AAF958_11360, partial [Planctomycetota bacterium]